MITNGCVPYLETKIKLLSPRMVEVSTPWLTVELAIPKEISQALIAHNPLGRNYILNFLANHPICAINPRYSLLKKFWKINSEPSIQQSILPSFAFNCWDVESIISKARIPRTNLYDPLALYSQIRKEFFSNFCDRESSNRLVLVANHSDKTFTQIANVILGQWYFLENCLSSSSAIAMSHHTLKQQLAKFLIDSSLTEKFLRQSFSEVIDLSKKTPKVFHENKTIGAVLTYSAKYHPLAFAMILDFICNIQYRSLVPVGKLLSQISNQPKLNQDFGRFIGKRHQMNCDAIPFRVMNDLGPTNRNGAVAAILTTFTVFTLFNRSKEKIVFKANEVLRNHPPLVLLSKVT